VAAAIDLVIPGELRVCARSECRIVVEQFDSFTPSHVPPLANGGRGRRKKASRSAKAGLTFPVGRIARYIKDGNYADRVGGKAAICLATALEYLATEVLELAGKAKNSAKKNMHRITQRHIKLAIGNDAELSELLSSAIIAGGGVLPTRVSA
jgi:histone H2A